MNDASESPPSPAIRVEYPSWVAEVVDWGRCRWSDEERMDLAIMLARENVERRAGGPFGAAIYECESGRLVAVGVNSVVRLNNCVLHAEIVAFMMAQARIGTYTLRRDDLPAHELVASCEPCAMCLGATLWSGVRRVVWGASRDDARRLAFEEGPVFAESYEYLRERGIGLLPNVSRDAANAVLELYRTSGGRIYNG